MSIYSNGISSNILILYVVSVFHSHITGQFPHESILIDNLMFMHRICVLCCPTKWKYKEWTVFFAGSKVQRMSAVCVVSAALSQITQQSFITSDARHSKASNAQDVSPRYTTQVMTWVRHSKVNKHTLTAKVRGQICSPDNTALKGPAY